MFANIDPVAVINMKVGPAIPVITLYDAETVIVLVAGLIVFTKYVKSSCILPNVTPWNVMGAFSEKLETSAHSILLVVPEVAVASTVIGSVPGLNTPLPKKLGAL